MDLRVKRGFIGTALARQQFFQFRGAIAPGFYWSRERLASFFSVFQPRGYMGPQILPTRKGQGFGCEWITALFTVFAKAFTLCARPGADF
jgi:hypothetical protein